MVVLDENPQTQHNEPIDVIDALELKLLDDIDETQFDVVENRPFDWIDEDEQVLVQLIIEIDEVEVVDEVEDTETVEIDEMLEGLIVLTVQIDETVEILDCIELDEKVDFEELFARRQVCDVLETDEIDIIDEGDEIEDENEELDVDDVES